MASFRPTVGCFLVLIFLAGAASAQSTTPWGDPDLRGIWTNFDLGEGVSLETPPPPGERASRLLIGTGTCFPSDEPIPEFEGGAGIGPPEHWFETSLDVGNVRPSLISDPENGRVPALTDAGSDRLDEICRRGFDNFIYLDPWVRCITRGIPASTFPSLYNNAYQILQIPGYVILRYEMIHDVRVIPLTDGPLSSSDISQWMGRSRGYFDGNTLLVETANFTNKSAIRGHAHTEHLRVVEMFTLTDQNTLDYEATISDPETWVTSWKVGIGLSRNDNYAMYEYACHEGNNYAMTSMLGGARAEERAGR